MASANETEDFRAFMAKQTPTLNPLMEKGHRLTSDAMAALLKKYGSDIEIVDAFINANRDKNPISVVMDATQAFGWSLEDAKNILETAGFQIVPESKAATP